MKNFFMILILYLFIISLPVTKTLLADSVVLTKLQEIQITPTPTHFTGDFCRVYYDSISNSVIVTYGGTKIGGISGSPNDKEYVYRKYDTAFVYSNQTGVLPNFTGASDYAMVRLHSRYYHLTGAKDAYQLTKFDNSFNFLNSVLISLLPNNSSNDQLFNAVNNKLYFASLYDTSAAGDSPDVLARFFVYDTLLNRIQDTILTDTTFMPTGGSIIYNNNKLHIVASDQFGSPRDHLPSHMYAYQYSIDWQYSGRKSLDTSGQWSQGLIYDSGFYYVAYHTPGYHGVGDIAVGIYDSSWNLVHKEMITNYHANFDTVVAQRPYIMKLNNKLYISYDIETFSMGTYNRDWQAVVAVYQLSFNTQPDTLPNFSFYYVSGAQNSHGIWLASQNGSGSWDRGSKVFLNDAFDGDCVDPDVVKLNDGRYRLYYFKGHFVTPPVPNDTLHKIYSAISSDGIHYTIEGLAFEHEFITDPSVVCIHDSLFLMAAIKSVHDTGYVVIAKSTNGRIFNQVTMLANVSIPELSVINEHTIRLYSPGMGGVVSKVSYDQGTTWQDESGPRLAYQGLAADPSVTQTESGKWIMLVKGITDSNAPGIAGHKVMVATSHDGNTFTMINDMILDSASVPDIVVLSSPTTQVGTTVIDHNLKSFTLYNNYPNPFQHGTTITYSLQSAGYVVLVVYNILGQKIDQLVNQYQTPGNYRIHFSADQYDLFSGVLYYKLNVDKHSQIKKMVFLK